MPAKPLAKTLTFRCPPALRRALERRAKAERRTVSNFVIKTLTEAVQGRRKPDAPPAEAPPEP